MRRPRRLQVLYWAGLTVVALIAHPVVAQTHPAVPTITIPNTDHLIGFTADSAVTVTTLRVLARGIPNESAVCWVGEVRWREMEGKRLGWIFVTDIRLAAIDSAGPNWVVFQCPNDPDLLGAVHSHVFHSCSADANPSDVDIVHLHHHPELLFLVAWCFDGSMTMLLQDGRRWEQRYVKERP